MIIDTLKRKIASAFWTIVVLLVLITPFAIGGGIFLLLTPRARPDIPWLWAKFRNRPETYLRFAASGRTHAFEARDLYVETAWLRAGTAPGAEAFRTGLRELPPAIRRFGEDRFWMRAVNEGDLERYLQIFPEGTFREAAEALRAWNQQSSCAAAIAHDPTIEIRVAEAIPRELIDLGATRAPPEGRSQDIIGPIIEQLANQYSLRKPEPGEPASMTVQGSAAFQIGSAMYVRCRELTARQTSAGMSGSCSSPFKVLTGGAATGWLEVRCGESRERFDFSHSAAPPMSNPSSDKDALRDLIRGSAVSPRVHRILVGMLGPQYALSRLYSKSTICSGLYELYSCDPDLEAAFAIGDALREPLETAVRERAVSRTQIDSAAEQWRTRNSQGAR